MSCDRNSLRLEAITRVFIDRKIVAKRYLDLGCGNGKLTSLIAKTIKASEAYGVDINCESLQRLPPPVRGVVFDFEELGNSRLQFNQEYFDVISAIEFIEHLSCGDELLKEAYRLLAPGGYLFITTPNLASLMNRFLLLIGYQPTYTAPSKNYYVGSRTVAKKSTVSEYGHKNLYTLSALKDILMLYNFEIVTITGCHLENDSFTFFPAARFPSLASDLIVLSQKK